MRRRGRYLLAEQYCFSEVHYFFDNHHFGSDWGARAFLEVGAVSHHLYVHAELLRTLPVGASMRNLLRSRRGSVAFATVIALVPLIGVVALGAEAGSWYVTHKHAQNAADSAAFSGALRLSCTMAGAAC